jgi:hypothetical protein
MSNEKKITKTMIRPNETVHIRGKVQYCRVTSQIQGKELENTNARRVNMGMSPIDKPHTSLTINFAEVVFKDPQNPTLEEQYIAERLYYPKQADKINYDTSKGLWCSYVNKGNTLPIVAVRRGNQLVEIRPEGELAQGMTVTMTVRTFKSKNYAGCGCTLNDIICEEEPIYRAGTAFADSGATFVPLQGYDRRIHPQAEPNGQPYNPAQQALYQPNVGYAQPSAGQPYNPAQNAPVQQYQAQPQAQPQYQAQPTNAPYNPAQSAPVQQPIQNTPAPAQPYSANRQPYNPAQNGAYAPVQQTQAVPNAPYNPAQNAPVQPAPQAPQAYDPAKGGAMYNPGQQTQAQPQGGIRYDPAADSRSAYIQ